ncbi:unnamed protein product, partial [marine sediment metagenome]
NVFEAAYNDSKLDDDRAQKLNERGDELKKGAMKLIQELTVSDQFANEEVKSSYGYLSGYKSKPIVEQMKVLRELFPELGSVDEKLAEADLPSNAEGWFAIPRWEKIASTYGEAVQKVLDLIKQTRDDKFYNYREGKLGSQYLRQHAKTAKMFQIFGDEQKDHDILVVPAQFGLNHRGKSVRRAREVMNASEFGLGAFAIGIMILTHPERLQHYDDLWIDCAGDEYAPGAGGGFSRAPCFCFRGGRVRFGTLGIGRPGGYCGSASGFVPQS